MREQNFELQSKSRADQNALKRIQAEFADKDKQLRIVVDQHAELLRCVTNCSIDVVEVPSCCDGGAAGLRATVRKRVAAWLVETGHTSWLPHVPCSGSPAACERTLPATSHAMHRMCSFVHDDVASGRAAVAVAAWRVRCRRSSRRGHQLLTTTMAGVLVWRVDAPPCCRLLETEEAQNAKLNQEVKDYRSELEALRQKYANLLQTAKTHEEMAAQAAREAQLRAEELRLLRAEVTQLRNQNVEMKRKMQVELESLQEQLRVRKEKQYALLERTQAAEEAKRQADDQVPRDAALPLYSTAVCCIEPLYRTAR